MLKPDTVPDSAIVALLFAVAVNVPDKDPFAVAAGLTSTVQPAPLAMVNDPMMQVPPLSKAKFVELDSDRPTAEDV